jgi:hypothetical protein
MARISRREWCRRIMDYLRWAAERDENRNYWDDYCLSWMTVAQARDGNPHPDVWACYTHLGLHQKRVWSAITARRKAQLGETYALFYDAAGNWKAEAEIASPKKPARSVRFTPEKFAQVVGMEDSRKTRSAGDLADPRRLKVVESPLDMGSTARAYRNPEASSSAKKPDIYSREEIARLLHLADFSREKSAKHPHHSRRDYRRDHLRSTLIGMWRAAGEITGREILLFASVEGYSVEAGKCVRQTRYNLRALEESGVIELAYPPNQRIRPGYFRHTATYRLRLDRLRQRQTYRQLRDNRPVAQPLPPRNVHAAPETPPPATAPISASDSHRSTERQPRQLTPREGRQLVTEMVQRMRGNANRPRMSQESALTTACQLLGIPYKSAEEHLRLCRWNFADANVAADKGAASKGQQQFERIKEARDKAHAIIDAHEFDDSDPP